MSTPQSTASPARAPRGRSVSSSTESPPTRRSAHRRGRMLDDPRRHHRVLSAWTLPDRADLDTSIWLSVEARDDFEPNASAPIMRTQKIVHQVGVITSWCKNPGLSCDGADDPKGRPPTRSGSRLQDAPTQPPSRRPSSRYELPVLSSVRCLVPKSVREGIRAAQRALPTPRPAGGPSHPRDVA